MEKLLYSIPEAAEVLGISKSMAYNLVHVEGFPIIKFGTRIMVPIKGLEEWTEKMTKEAMKA